VILLEKEVVDRNALICIHDNESEPSFITKKSLDDYPIDSWKEKLLVTFMKTFYPFSLKLLIKVVNIIDKDITAKSTIILRYE